MGEKRQPSCRTAQRRHHRSYSASIPCIEVPHPVPRPEWDPKLEPHERRHSGRVEASGSAIVHGPCVARARILDLAVGGLGLLVDADASVPDVGTHVRVEFRLDGCGRWLHVIGRVARVDARGSSSALVIELLVVPPEFEDLVQDELLAALECAEQPQILLVDATRRRRELVAAAFRATGCSVIEVSSPLEAITEIGQSRLHLRAVVIADTELASRADELRRFLDEAYPRVPLIVVGRRRHGHGRTRISVDRVPDLALQIDHVVGMSGQVGSPL